jgi:uncharacterized protein YndB with AHSA1/START domain
MTVVNVHKDPEAALLVVTAEFAAPLQRVWQLWADPRQLERWWGPPGYPATFVEHDLSPGTTVTYFMTSPEGEKYHGWWRIGTVEEPTRFTFQDGFGDSDGTPNPEMPVTEGVVEFVESPTGTTMTMTSTYASREDFERVLAMGMEEGITLALGQIEGILADTP